MTAYAGAGGSAGATYGGNAGGAQAPKRTSGGSWMSELGKRQG